MYDKITLTLLFIYVDNFIKSEVDFSMLNLFLLQLKATLDTGIECKTACFMTTYLKLYFYKVKTYIIIHNYHDDHLTEWEDSPEANTHSFFMCLTDL